MRQTFGPYDSQKQAMRSIRQMSMKGGFLGGRFIRYDGNLMVSTACRAYRTTRDGESEWVADVTLRPATEAEVAQHDAMIAKRAAERQAAAEREHAR